ncbi:MAG: glycosyltransferase family 9 protein, partial [Chitinispirillaceae bacterium]|nr:glycosyltransferase family 9 protein [Chitinispirillaceae bacterium]
MRKIIITPLIGIGDVLMTFPALELLKKKRPDATITYCAMNQGTFDVCRGNPFIDKLVLYPMLGANKLRAVIRLISECSGRYGVSINFYPSNRMHYNLFSLLTLAPKRVGHTYLRMNTSQLNWLKNYTITENDALHCVEENVALLSLLGIDFAGVPVPPLSIYLDESEIAGGKAFRNTFGGRPVIGVHAGTSVFKGHAARRWPKERFAEVIRNFPDAHFLLFGTSEEEEANRFILGNVSGNATLVTDKTIRQVGAIIKSCDFFISNDSGLMHLAAAVRTPVIAVIGPTN